MVDDAEFVRRRHLSRGRPRKFDASPSCSQSLNSFHPLAAYSHPNNNTNNNANLMTPGPSPSHHHHQHQLHNNHPHHHSHPLQPAPNFDFQTGSALYCGPALTHSQSGLTATNSRSMPEGMQSKSPTLTPSPTLYGETLNASLQAALAESNLNFIQRSVNDSPVNLAEDNSSLDNLHDSPMRLVCRPGQGSPVKRPKLEEHSGDRMGLVSQDLKKEDQAEKDGGSSSGDDSTLLRSRLEFYRQESNEENLSAAHYLNRTLKVEVDTLQHSPPAPPPTNDFYTATPNLSAATKVD